MGDDKKSIISWALYDWANSAFATTILVGFFPVFFKKYCFIGNNIESTAAYGYIQTIISLIIVLIAPILGSIADRGNARKRFLAFFAYLSIVFTANFYFINKGEWVKASFLFIAASVCFWSSNIFYDSLLPTVASEKKIDFVSILGFSLGYIGGGLLFLINVVMFLKPSLFGLSSNIQAVKFSFITVAAWWFIFSLPLFLNVKEPVINEKTGILKSIASGIFQLVDTFKEIKKLKVVSLFLLAYWFYIDGVHTIIKMATDYGLNLNFPASSLIVAILLVQFIGFPTTLLYNLISKKIGLKNAIFIGITGYIFITLFGYFMNKIWHFYALAGLVGLFQGGIQALSRSIFVRIIPKKKAAQFFGFYDMFGKFATIIGPALLALTVQITGNKRLGILSILTLLIIGAVIFFFVNIKEGQKIINEGNDY
jgi:UMF1 family MFS transporter